MRVAADTMANMSDARGEMNVRRFDDAGEFLRLVTPLLMQREAENNLVLGIAARLAAAGPPGDALLIAVSDREGRAIGAAVRTPPYPLVIARMPPEAMADVARLAMQASSPLNRVSGPSPDVAAMARALSSLTGSQARLNRCLRIHQLDRVVPPQAQAPGRVRPAEVADLELVAEWISAFWRDVGEHSGDDRAAARRAIDERRLHLWCVRYQPVSMAAQARPSANITCVSQVYTPPAFRRRGYASAVVAAVSQLILDSGKRHAVLFTDLANPTSNSIYRKLGYRPVCDWEDWVVA
jgi:hypothetical protein